MFKRILLAVDGSEHSIKATEYSIKLAQKFDSAIDAVYVVDESTAKKDALHSNNQFEIERKRKEKIRPIRERLDESKIIFGTHILHGDPGPTIVKFANERAFDCVVIGSRGLNQLQTLILGSVSHKVAKRANCPVLIIK
ncbi:universal stress protein [Oceanobacillus luteolus]|uniref:Universal stress protein n=1 Tax=Oceanobacillus luteolus TaxID=1274358 RepID=A0ABW4HTA3_9BACI|nr:universal stress protein [Oceanobacillus luteolus]MCM3739665.1 universal stress protein [Oceanobacillus luteolus]